VEKLFWILNPHIGPLPLKCHWDEKFSCYFIAFLKSMVVVKHTVKISAPNSISFFTFFRSKHANFVAAITELPISEMGRLPGDVTSFTQGS
jgi:hypothetical protein